MATKTQIVLFPISTYDRKGDAEFIEGNTYDINEVESKFTDPDILIMDLSDFADYCNNQDFKVDNYWVTWVIFTDTNNTTENN